MSTMDVKSSSRHNRPWAAFWDWGSPQRLAELLAHAGSLCCSIQTEHNALDSAEIQHMLMATNATETIPIAQVPSTYYVFIQRALDMGAMGS